MIGSKIKTGNNIEKNNTNNTNQTNKTDGKRRIKT